MNLAQFAQKYVPVLQKYIFAEDPQAFLATQLTSKTQELFFEFMLQPSTDSQKKLMESIGVTWNIRDQLVLSKVHREFRTAVTKEEQTRALEGLKKIRPGYFDYPKPAQAASSVAYVQENKPVELAQQTLQTQSTVQQVVKRVLQEDPNNFFKLSAYGLKHLSLEYVRGLQEQHFGFLMDKKDVLLSLPPEETAEFLAFLIRKSVQQKGTSIDEESPSELFQMLTQQQLIALKSKLPQIFNNQAYHQQLFRENYEPELQKYKSISELTPDQIISKKQLCLKYITQLQKNRIHNSYFIEKLTQQILLLDQAFHNIDLTFFLNYLQNIKNIEYRYFREQFQQRIKLKYGKNKYHKKTQRPLTYLDSSKFDQRTIVARSIASLFHKDQPGLFQKLQIYVSEKHLRKQQALVLLSRGLQSKIVDLNNIIPLRQLTELKQKKQITFTPRNKKTYRAGQEVNLYLKVKNVDQITAKIYEIDLQKELVYSDHIRQDINLRYLVPAQQKIFQIKSQDSFQEVQEVIKLDQLKDRLGMFIVELQAQEISSRFVLKKGAILCENRTTQTGHQLNFYDQDGKQIERLHLWRDGKRVEVNKNYQIPYDKRHNQNIIAVYGGFATTIPVQILSQQYGFDVDYIYHGQSFIKGTKAKIILHPRLKLHKTKQVSLKQLRKVQIKIDTINNQNISATTLLQNVIFKDQEDYVLEIPIKSYLKTISIQIKGQVELINRIVFNVVSQKNISIDLQEGNDNFVDIYLQKNTNGYTLKVAGKNGEPIINTDAVLQYEQFGANMSLGKQLRTNSKGEIGLGEMKQVKKITAKVTSQEYTSSRTWKIRDLSEQTCFGGDISSQSSTTILQQGSNFSVPLPYQVQNLNKDVIFLHVDQERGVTTNQLTNARIEGGRFVVNNLKKGKYRLIFLRLDRRIDLVVVRGKKWIDGQIIDQTVNCYKLRQANQWLALGQIKAQSKQKHVQLSIDIISQGEDLPKDLRVHVFAKNYVDSHNQDMFTAKSLSDGGKASQKLKIGESNYYNNKRLSQQTAYVLNRRNQQMIAGNNLEKPHMFLKRIEVGSTTTRDEVLLGESNYDSFANVNYSRGMPMMKQMAFGAAPSQYAAYSSYYNRGVAQVALNRTLNSHNNFLLQTGHLKQNLRKITSIQIPLGYSSIVVVLFSKGISLKRQYAIPSSPSKTIDLSHPLIQDQNKQSGWTMNRDISSLHVGQSRQVGRNSAWSAVGVSEVIQYAKTKNVVLPEWLTGWRGYSQPKKREVYDKDCCHQLNFFLYRNDKQFFESVVRPFIANKLTKTFLDYYLLDDKKAIIEYSRVYNMHKLNGFEKALLPQKLRQYGLQKEAVNIAQSLVLPLKNLKTPAQEFKTFFETVLNSKKQAERPTYTGGATYTTSGSVFGGFSAAGLPPPPPPPGIALAPQFDMPYAALQQCDMMAQQNEQGFVTQYNLAKQQMQAQCYKCDEDDGMQMRRNSGQIQAAKNKYKAGFKQTQKTKQYTQTTYSTINDPQLIPSLISVSPFWSELANHNSQASSKPFLSWQFAKLFSALQFTLAISLLPQDSQPEYDIEATVQGYKITAKSPFLIFVKEVASLGFNQEKSVVINQRLFDHKNRYIFQDDGSQRDRQVSTFIVQKPYTLQTIVSNISGFALQTQLLVDIPQGAIPLRTHEETQIKNMVIPAYNTMEFQRSFYFPAPGTYHLYPANATKGKIIVAKAPQNAPLLVLVSQPVSTLETLDNILRSGTQDNILQYLRTRNIFDPNVFDLGLVLWKLKDRSFYQKVLSIFRERNYFDDALWSFGIYHNDFQTVKQLLTRQNTLQGMPKNQLPIFEYFPYYSSRYHQFVKQNKSTIRVKQFKETYAQFLFAGVFEKQNNTDRFKMALVYYLLLQDRIAEAKIVYKGLVGEQFSLQKDYVDCYLDLFQGAANDYATARNISEKYKEYPVLAWRKLFKQANQALNKSDQIEGSQGSTKAQQTTFSTTVINSGNELRISRPGKTRVVVNAYQIDIELYFSEAPFDQVNAFSALNPSKTIVLQGNDFKTQKVERSQFERLKDFFIDVYEQKPNTTPKKITSFLWTNPDVKVKISQRQGTLKVFYKGRRSSTSYCKVYTKGSKGQRFYRDGYTDVASTFRYALDVADISEFSILVLTDHGGSISRVRPPSVYS